MGDEFEVVGDITEVELIAKGREIRDPARLNRQHGRGRWRKMKGEALIRPPTGRVRRAELHWYKVHGIGRREMKRKRCID